MSKPELTVDQMLDHMEESRVSRAERIADYVPHAKAGGNSGTLYQGAVEDLEDERRHRLIARIFKIGGSR